MKVRTAGVEDLALIADLHTTRINEGFLSSLGSPFLRRLYRRVLNTDAAFALVAADERDQVIGFAAGVGDLPGFYRSFLLHDGIAAGIRSAPRLVRSIPRVIETLRYGSSSDTLPTAEILAVAVGAASAGRGVGRSLVIAATAEFTRLGIETAKVVTTADNASAIAMYHAGGFQPATAIEVHPGRASQVMVWTSSSH